jgi:hypothetical protein
LPAVAACLAIPACWAALVEGAALTVEVVLWISVGVLAADRLEDAVQRAQRSDTGGAASAGSVRNLTDRALRDAGVDAEAAKGALLGEDGGRFKIGVNTSSGEVVLTPVRRGSGPNVPTGQTLEDLARDFPLGGS